ncbi:MAG: hypothetical protein ACO2O0_00335 [Desulfurococcales archaeon]
MKKLYKQLETLRYIVSATINIAKEFEVSYNPDNVVTADIKENNVTPAVYINRRLHEIYRIETNIGRIVIAHSERRRRITSDRSIRDRVARKILEGFVRGRRRRVLSIKQLGRIPLTFC